MHAWKKQNLCNVFYVAVIQVFVFLKSFYPPLEFCFIIDL
jgi:hypothetical protein